MGAFKKAVKTGLKLRMAITGPAGSGKTYTALALATAMGLPIAYIDTEHGSASKYADLFEFDVMEMRPPFNPERFVKGIEMAASEGYAVVVIDSLSHAWSGTGGILEMVEEASTRTRGNSYAAWKDVTPKQNALIEAIVGSDIHIIATMRSKMDYVQDKDDRGKTSITKVGMAPVQREGFEYEFDVVMDMDIKHNGIITKTRCPAITDKVFRKPGADVAKILSDWLSSGQAAVAERVKPSPTTEQRPQAQPATPFDDEPTEQPKGNKAHKYMFGHGLSTFGDDWDAARPWLIEQWTKKHTPDNVRTSSGDLTDQEKTQLGDSMKENGAMLQEYWSKHLAKMQPELAAA